MIKNVTALIYKMLQLFEHEDLYNVELLAPQLKTVACKFLALFYCFSQRGNAALHIVLAYTDAYVSKDGILRLSEVILTESSHTSLCDQITN